MSDILPEDGTAGTLTNTVNHCDGIAPWTLGVSALMRSLAGRGLLK